MASLQEPAALEAKKLLLSLTLFSLLSMTLYGMQYLSGQFRSAVMAVFPRSLLFTSYLFAAGSGDRVGKRGSFDAVHALFSNNQNTGVIQHWFRHKSKAQHQTGCYRKS